MAVGTVYPELPAVEYQARRPYLKDFNVNSYEDLIQRLPDMWRNMTGEWSVIKSPNKKDTNHRRWNYISLWQAVQEVGSQFGECLGVQRWKQKQAKIDPLMAQVEGLLASILAIVL